MSKTKFEFSNQFGIPPHFPEVLKSFSREILRVQPANVEDFAIKYFERCLASGEENQVPEGDLSLGSIESLVKDLFIAYDEDESGYLDPREFRKLINDFAEKIHLPKDEIFRFFAEADLNEDGKIEWGEFVPLSIQIVQTLHAQANLTAQEENAQKAADNFLVHGMTRDELTETVSDIFRQMDGNQNGTLSRLEFVSGMTSMDLGLTRRELNTIMMQVDSDDDGQITYTEFVPFCYDLLHKLASMRMLEMQMQDNEFVQFLTDLFRAKDVENSGMVFFDDIKDLLHQAMLGLSRMQIYTVASEGEPNDEGLVNYREFIPKAATLIRSILSFEQSLANSTNMASSAELEAQMKELFDGLDDATTYNQFENVIGQSGLFNEREQNAMLHLGLNGMSKTQCLASNTPISVATVKAEAFKLTKQIRMSIV